MDGVQISQEGENNMFPMWKRGAHDKGWEMHIAGGKDVTDAGKRAI